MVAHTKHRSARDLSHMLARLSLLAGLLGSGPQAWGLDFSAEAPAAQQGQPLRLQVALRTDPGEALRAECIKADIVDGERLLTGPDVTVRLEPSGAEGHWTALLMTQAPITQTLIKVTLSAGCEKRLWRRYTLKALPSPHAPEARPMAPTKAAQEPPLLDVAGGAAAATALLLLGAGLAWLARHPLVRSRQPAPQRRPASPEPTKSAAAPRQRLPGLGRPQAKAPVALKSTQPASPPPPPAVHQKGPLAPPLRTVRPEPVDPERQWPEIEQQANILAAQGLLGTAVELVMHYVRSARRAQLMPYLKLLQLQRRRGDRAAFDDTRTLLEQNFKLHAPTWSGQRRALPAPPEPDDAALAPKPEDSHTPERQSCHS